MASSSEPDPTRAKERRRQRKLHRDRCIPDPDRPGKRLNPEPECPHGTVSGHDNWGCQCLDLGPPDPDTGESTGCEPAAVAADRGRRSRRRCLLRLRDPDTSGQ